VVVVLEFRSGWWVDRVARHVELFKLASSPHGRVDLERDCKGVENL
jgi:hypothetical protein